MYTKKIVTQLKIKTLRHSSKHEGGLNLPQVSLGSVQRETALLNRRSYLNKEPQHKSQIPSNSIIFYKLSFFNLRLALEFIFCSRQKKDKKVKLSNCNQRSKLNFFCLDTVQNESFDLLRQKIIFDLF
uniref:Uncharacterized protein n=1 Tax=Cacopsylla melanoneura TaxID=428564 RepID=A0A8D8S6L1_9HEMI